VKKENIKNGQIWRSKGTNHCIKVGQKVKDDCWYVYPFNISTQLISKKKVHKMQECSFHFYELIEKENLNNKGI